MVTGVQTSTTVTLKKSGLPVTFKLTDLTYLNYLDELKVEPLTPLRQFLYVMLMTFKYETSHLAHDI